MTRYKEQQKMKKCPLIYNSVIFPIPPLTFLPLFRTYDNMILSSAVGYRSSPHYLPFFNFQLPRLFQ